MSMVGWMCAGWTGISQERLSLLVACVYDMMLTDETDRLINGLVGGGMILVGFCKQSGLCIRRSSLGNANDAKLKRYGEIWRD